MLKNIPPVTRNLLFINIIIFMVQLVLQQRIGNGSDILVQTFGLHFYMAPDFRIWQLLTYMFLHGSWSHVLLNMFSLWMFGRIIEQTMSQKRYLIYYLICGVGAGLCQEVWQAAEYYLTGMGNYALVDTGRGVIPVAEYLNMWNTIGASGACYGILLAFGMTFPNERIMLFFPPIPLKAKYFVVGYAAIELLSAFSSNSNVAHFAHLGGMLFGYLLIRHWRRVANRPRFTGWDDYARQRNGGGQRGVMRSISSAFQRFGAALEEAVRSVFGKKGKKQHGNMRYDNMDYDYNARKKNEKSKERQERIDRILDKVRRSGYDSLTEEEKRTLFEDKE